MQKYMAEHCSPRKVEKEDGKEEDGAIVSFRKKVAQKDRTGKAGGMKYLASSFLVLTIFVLGMTILNNYDKMKQIEEAMSRLTVEQEGAENTALTQAVSADAAEKQEETREMEEENEKEGEEAQEAAAREEWETQGEEEQETEQETESQTAAEADLTDASASHVLQERNYSLEDPGRFWIRKLWEKQMRFWRRPAGRVSRSIQYATAIRWRTSAPGITEAWIKWRKYVN